MKLFAGSIKFASTDVLLTVSVAVQGLAFCVLLSKLKSEKVSQAAQFGIDTSGCSQAVSRRMVFLFTLSFAFRFASTAAQTDPDMACFVPDHVGNVVYRPMELMCAIFALTTLVQLHKMGWKTPESKAADSMPVWPFLVLSSLLAYTMGTQCNYAALDFLYNSSHWLDTFALMPQFWLVSKQGSAHGGVSHFVALLVLARAISGAFWVTHYASIAHLPDPSEFLWEVFHGTDVFFSHVVCFFISADYMFQYMKTMARRRMDSWDTCWEV